MGVIKNGKELVLTKKDLKWLKNEFLKHKQLKKSKKYIFSNHIYFIKNMKVKIRKIESIEILGLKLLIVISKKILDLIKF